MIDKIQIKKPITEEKATIINDELYEQVDNAFIEPQPLMEEGAKNASLDLKKLGFSEKLKVSLSILAEDTNKASVYFKPVVASAKKVLSGAGNKESLAKEMGTLLNNMFYYLDNRGSSMLSPQRRARRAACEKLIGDIGVFLYEADSVFADRVRISVGDKISADRQAAGDKKSSNLTRAEQFDLDYGYVTSFDAIESKLAKEAFLSPEFKAKSKNISDIRHYMEGLNAIMTNKMPPVPGKKAKQADKKAYEDEIKMTGLGISKMYQGIIDACNNALADPSLSQEEKKTIKDLLKGYDHDNMVLQNSISRYVAGNQGTETVTWAEAIATKGSSGVQLNKRGVTKMGNGTSVVYKYSVKGENKYFKENETVSKTTEGAFNSIFSKRETTTGYRPSFEKELAKFNAAMEEQFGGFYKTDISALKGNEDFYKIYMTLVGRFEMVNANGFVAKAKKAPKKMREENPLIKYLATLDKEWYVTDFIEDMVDDFLKKFNSDKIMADSVQVDGGNKVSTRNVATSRMADLLGISGMVAHSETAEMKKGNKVVVGNVMEEAKGYEAKNLAGHPQYKYTTQAVNQMSIMQIFDMICGQVDRNRTNYFVDVTNINITGVKMIDNDLSFGKLKIKKGDTTPMQMTAYSKMSLDAIPVEFADAIKKLDEYAEEDLTFFFGDLLKEDEIAALKQRISFIANGIKEREAEYKRMAKEGSKEEKKIAANMKDNKFRAIYYQYQLYQKFEDLEEEAPIKEIPLHKKKLSYLNETNMQDFNDIEAQYKQYLKKKI